ncbi:hypothetical protein [Clostridium diolis]|uniref:hypothetical protein n=1 Tax=Clostridium diolis TaxID=223919 RepID=UPI003AF5EA4D
METTTSSAVTIEQIDPYLKQYETDNTLTNGLLFVLISYLIFRDVAKYINSWIRGGMM